MNLVFRYITVALETSKSKDKKLGEIFLALQDSDAWDMTWNQTEGLPSSFFKLKRMESGGDIPLPYQTPQSVILSCFKTHTPFSSDSITPPSDDGLLPPLRSDEEEEEDDNGPEAEPEPDDGLLPPLRSDDEEDDNGPEAEPEPDDGLLPPLRSDETGFTAVLAQPESPTTHTGEEPMDTTFSHLPDVVQPTTEEEPMNTTPFHLPGVVQPTDEDDAASAEAEVEFPNPFGALLDFLQATPDAETHIGTNMMLEFDASAMQLMPGHELAMPADRTTVLLERRKGRINTLAEESANSFLDGKASNIMPTELLEATVGAEVAFKVRCNVFKLALEDGGKTLCAEDVTTALLPSSDFGSELETESRKSCLPDALFADASNFMSFLDRKGGDESTTTLVPCFLPKFPTARNLHLRVVKEDIYNGFIPGQNDRKTSRPGNAHDMVFSPVTFWMGQLWGVAFSFKNVTNTGYIHILFPDPEDVRKAVNPIDRICYPAEIVALYETVVNKWIEQSKKTIVHVQKTSRKKPKWECTPLKGRVISIWYKNTRNTVNPALFHRLLELYREVYYGTTAVSIGKMILDMSVHIFDRYGSAMREQEQNVASSEDLSRLMQGQTTCPVSTILSTPLWEDYSFAGESKDDLRPLHECVACGADWTQAQVQFDARHKIYTTQGIQSAQKTIESHKQRVQEITMERDKLITKHTNMAALAVLDSIMDPSKTVAEIQQSAEYTQGMAQLQKTREQEKKDAMEEMKAEYDRDMQTRLSEVKKTMTGLLGKKDTEIAELRAQISDASGKVTQAHEFDDAMQMVSRLQREGLETFQGMDIEEVRKAADIINRAGKRKRRYQSDEDDEEPRQLSLRRRKR